MHPTLKLRDSKRLNSHRIFKRPAKALIRLCICAGWSEPSLAAHTKLLEISCRGLYVNDPKNESFEKKKTLTKMRRCKTRGPISVRVVSIYDQSPQSLNGANPSNGFKKGLEGDDTFLDCRMAIIIDLSFQPVCKYPLSGVV